MELGVYVKRQVEGRKIGVQKETQTPEGSRQRQDMRGS